MNCGCTAPYIGPGLEATCGSSNSYVLFMSLLTSFITNKCDVSEICQRVKPKMTPDDEYDFVVIGGGSGGATAAGRLAEVPNWKVLLIEAGNDEPPGSQVPSMVTNYFYNDALDWGYKTEPEPVACQGEPDKRCQWIRGKVLGGCSVLNGMMYMRGVPRDYDNWAQAGNSGWSNADVMNYFKRSEDNKEIGTLVDKKYHGQGGPWTVSRFPDHPQLAEDVLQAGKELGYPISDDLCGSQITGFTIAQTNNRNGTRLSSARAYVRPHRNNPNFHVMLNSTASKILVDTNTNGQGQKRATGVQFIYNGRTHTVRVKKEVIVAGGAVNSPQILLLSGIGPAADLRRVGIQQVHELPGVGRNLHNHVTFYLTYNLRKLADVNDLDWAVAMDYLLNRKGPMTSTGMSQVTARINTKFAEPSGTNPDLQIFFGGYTAKCAESGEVGALHSTDSPRTMSMAPVVLHPKSRGYITLKSNNPLDPPAIYANYLTEPEDVATLVEGVRICQRLGNTTILRERYGAELEVEYYGDCADKHGYDTDDFWDCAVKHATGPENHQVGSCKMGPSTDSMAVVNDQLQVHGIPNIRIMDASIMPTVVSGNTASTCVMIAEKGTDLIKLQYPQLPSRGGFEEQEESESQYPANPLNPNRVPQFPTQRPPARPNRPHYPAYQTTQRTHTHHYSNKDDDEDDDDDYPRYHSHGHHGHDHHRMHHDPYFHKMHPEIPNPFNGAYP